MNITNWWYVTETSIWKCMPSFSSIFQPFLHPCITDSIVPLYCDMFYFWRSQWQCRFCLVLHCIIIVLSNSVAMTVGQADKQSDSRKGRPKLMIQQTQKHEMYMKSLCLIYHAIQLKRDFYLKFLSWTLSSFCHYVYSVEDL